MTIDGFRLKVLIVVIWRASVVFCYHTVQKPVMFRTAIRRFGTSALRSAATMEAPSTHLIEIAKAQRIAQGGFIDGIRNPFLGYLRSDWLTCALYHPLATPL